MKFSHFFLTAGVLAFAAPAFAADLKDGSFEKPQIAAGTQQLFNVGDRIGPWKVVGEGDVALIGADNTLDGLSLQAKNGLQFVNLAGDQRLQSGLEQTFKTVPGTQYLLWFRIGAIVDRDQGFLRESTVVMTIDGEPKGIFTVTADTDGTKVTWGRVGVVFTAANDTTTIDFFNGDGPIGGFCALDGLSLKVDNTP